MLVSISRQSNKFDEWKEEVERWAAQGTGYIVYKHEIANIMVSIKWLLVVKIISQHAERMCRARSYICTHA